MSEHQADQSSAETSGSTIDAGSHTTADAAAAPKESMLNSTHESMKIDSPKIQPEQPASEAPKIDIGNGEPKMEAHKAEAPRVESPHTPGKVMIMSPQRERAWHGEDLNDEPSSDRSPRTSGLFGKRRAAALAAVIALAAVTGAVGGALATSAIGHFSANSDAKTAANRALEDSIARVDADVAALKANLERANKTSGAQFAKANDRLDKVEKAQAEPNAKIAKLSETVDKLRAPAPTPAPVATAPTPVKETTASIQTPVPTPAPKPEVSRLPTIESWVLRDVVNGGAMIEGRQGLYEVFAGDPIPGLGRVDAIRKQDGRWVVVTSKGLIVAR